MQFAAFLNVLAALALAAVLLAKTAANAVRLIQRSGVQLSCQAFCAALMLLLSGCGVDESASKTSHFEHDHVVASHWPNDLADIAAKLRKRLSIPEPNTESLAEIEDLVSWTAEVAADTNLPESEWVPLYEASKSTMANLRSAKGRLTPENRKQVESLCDLITQAAGRIPEHMPILVRGET
ncbi:hypothetical protein [Rubripirellula tenax]|nr:hypothetical protein [Rubripirellula tenax]